MFASPWCSARGQAHYAENDVSGDVYVFGDDSEMRREFVRVAPSVLFLLLFGCKLLGNGRLVIQDVEEERNPRVRRSVNIQRRGRRVDLHLPGTVVAFSSVLHGSTVIGWLGVLNHIRQMHILQSTSGKGHGGSHCDRVDVDEGGTA